MGEGTEKKALFIATVGGFVTQFEMNNIHILMQMGYEIHSAANYKEPVYCVREEELRGLGVILHHVDIAKSPFLWRQNLHALQQIRGIIREEGITLIHCHTPVGGVLGRLSGIRCGSPGVKVVYTAHGFHFYKGAPWRNWIFYYTVERLLARFTDSIVTINREDYGRACRFRLREEGMVYRIPGEGLDLVRFDARLREKKQELRRKLGIPEDVFFLLSIGELSGNKNHRQVIGLMPKLQERLAPGKVWYGICGDGFYRRELEGEIRRLELEGQVRIHGYCPEVEEFLACADCFIFPSVREGLGMAALEALAMGVPVVASDNRGTREYIEDGVNGFVYCTKRPEELIRKVGQVSRMTEGELAAMGEAGRMTAERFGLAHADKVMREVYRRVDGTECAMQEGQEPMPGEGKPLVGFRRAAEEGAPGGTQMDGPKISVLMSTYNPSRDGGFPEAVKSVLDQTYGDFEFLICDDGSGEEGAGLLEETASKDSRIHLLRNRERRGLAYGLNRCIREARGSYLARMDDDDFSLPDRLQVQLKYLEGHPEVGFVGCNAKLMSGDRIWGSRRMPERPSGRDFLKYSPYIHPTVMFRRSVFQGREGYRTDTERGEDLELFMRLADEGIQGVNLQQELFCYREERGSYQRRTVKSRLDEAAIRCRGYGRLKILFPAGWLCALRPLAAACVPPGMLYWLKAGRRQKAVEDGDGAGYSAGDNAGYDTGDSAGEGKRKGEAAQAGGLPPPGREGQQGTYPVRGAVPGDVRCRG